MKFVAITLVALLMFAGALVAANWDWFVRSYDQVSRNASEAAAGTMKELGQGSYHAAQCGDEQLRQRLEAAISQVPFALGEAMRDSFDAGVEEARTMNVDYTPEVCAQVRQAVEQAYERAGISPDG